MSMFPNPKALVADRFLSIPIHDPSLRIWLEHKLASELLPPGEAVRRDVIKLFPQTLLRLLDESDSINSPTDAIDRLWSKLPYACWPEVVKPYRNFKTSCI
jgi:hypothetical protein